MKYNFEKIIVGSRESKLAKVHIEILKKEFKIKIKHKNPLQIETKFIKTSGDKFLDKKISEIGNKGLFTKEIDLAQIKNDLHIGIHSLKDLPTKLLPGLEIISVLKREDPRDAVYSEKYKSLGNIKKGAIIGTSSIRRKNQMLNLNADFVIKDIRGNVDTRINKLRDGKFDAIILASSGLKRLGIKKSYFPLDTNILVPAVGQGVIALVGNSINKEINKVIKIVNHEQTQIEVNSEREFLRALDGSCETPIGAYAELKRLKGKDLISLLYFVSSIDGKKIIKDKKNINLRNYLSESYNLGKDVKRRLKL